MDDTIQSGVAELIAEIAQNLSYTSADFRREFESLLDRKATLAEAALFLRNQREAKEKKAQQTSIGSSNDSDSLPRNSPREYESYVFKKRIGGGAYGNVYMGEHKKTGAVRAIKIISLNHTKESTKIDGDLKIGTEFGKRCVFLVDYEQVAVRHGECYVLMEYCGGGDLRQLLDTRMEKKKPFDENEILRFLVEVGMALQTLHGGNVVHRDIKPQNIFLTSNGSYKLGDYGTARFLTDHISMSMAGTSGYMAPEILQGETGYLTGVDIYSLGCILLEMMELQHPFKNETGNLNIVNVSLGKPNPIKSTQFSPALVALAKRMISVDSSKRPTVGEVLASLPVVGYLTSTYAEMRMKEIAESLMK